VNYSVFQFLIKGYALPLACPSFVDTFQFLIKGYGRYDFRNRTGHDFQFLIKGYCCRTTYIISAEKLSIPH